MNNRPRKEATPEELARQNLELAYAIAFVAENERITRLNNTYRDRINQFDQSRQLQDLNQANSQTLLLQWDYIVQPRLEHIILETPPAISRQARGLMLILEDRFNALRSPSAWSPRWAKIGKMIKNAGSLFGEVFFTLTSTAALTGLLIGAGIAIATWIFTPPASLGVTLVMIATFGCAGGLLGVFVGVIAGVMAAVVQTVNNLLDERQFRSDLQANPTLTNTLNSFIDSTLNSSANIHFLLGSQPGETDVQQLSQASPPQEVQQYQPHRSAINAVLEQQSSIAMGRP